jgi:Fic family protein
VYFPKPIPRSLVLDEQTSAELSNADRALGRLAGSGRLLKNPLVIADLYIRREALSSTRIEGTQATLDDLYEAEASGAIGSDVREVLNYIHALYQGLEEVRKSKLSIDLMKRLHIELMSGVRGEDKQPGEIRDRPNWIGSNDPATARFVPPPHTELQEGLTDWVAFAAQDLMMPPLVKCALLHYQFETLHPFLDGNGRLGRLLIILFLVHYEHLPIPLLYLSTYLENHKTEYYDALQGVRERGDIQTWLQYFLRAVAIQANDAVRRSERLVDLGDVYRSRLAGFRGRAHELVDELLASPIITTQHVRDKLGMTSQGALRVLRHLETLGIVKQVASRPGRSSRWVAPEAMAAVRD